MGKYLVLLISVIATLGCEEDLLNWNLDRIPVVESIDVTDITAVSAVSGGSVTNEGSSTVIARGVCWGISEKPTIEEDSITIDGNGLGNYQSFISNLSPGTQYYTRAYATNKAGTSYGVEFSFKTDSILTPIVLTTATSDIGYTTATSGGTVVDEGSSSVIDRGVCWSNSQDPTIEDSITLDGNGVGAYTSLISGLLPDTTYYVRAYATNSFGTTYGNEMTFSTVVGLPSLSTASPSNIFANRANVGGDITDMGAAPVSVRGVCWSTSQGPTVINNFTTDGNGIGSYNSMISGLTPNTTYYVRAYATNSFGTAYGNEITFTTTDGLPNIATETASLITASTVNTGGNVIDNGDAPVTSRGICWSTSPNPFLGNNYTNDGSGTGAFVSVISGLTPNTTYYVRAYATNSFGTAYGNEITFTTIDGLPSVQISNTSSITPVSANSGGNVVKQGSSNVTDRGVCWSTSPNPSLGNNYTNDGSGTGAFVSVISGLTPNTTYYVRAYATNSFGTAYSIEMTFTTAPGPTASFSESDTIIGEGTSITFNSTATGNPTSYLWEFEGGSPTTASGPSWNVLYNTYGLFDVKHRVSNNFSADSVIANDHIYVTYYNDFTQSNTNFGWSSSPSTAVYYSSGYNFINPGGVLTRWFPNVPNGWKITISYNIYRPSTAYNWPTIALRLGNNLIWQSPSPSTTSTGIYQTQTISIPPGSPSSFQLNIESVGFYIGSTSSGHSVKVLNISIHP